MEELDNNWRYESDVQRCSTPVQMLEWLKAVDHALVEGHYNDAEYALSVVIKAVKKQINSENKS